MKLIIGLGNPGGEYSNTRHNIGRRLVEFIAAKNGLKFRREKKLHAFIAELTSERELVLIAYPDCYMNVSGISVKAIFDHCRPGSLQNVLVAVDDVALPFGRMRLRAGGSAGGHNGLLSVEEAFDSRDYPRLRIGIGVRHGDDPNKSVGAGEPLHDYVLAPFSRDEERMIPELLERGSGYCRDWVLEPFEKAMGKVNSTKL